MKCIVCEKQGKLFGTYAGVKLIYCKEHEFIFKDLQEESKRAKEYGKRRI